LCWCSAPHFTDVKFADPPHRYAEGGQEKHHPRLKYCTARSCEGNCQVNVAIRARVAHVGWVESKAKPITTGRHGGFRCAQPSLRLKDTGRARCRTENREKWSRDKYPAQQEQRR